MGSCLYFWLTESIVGRVLTHDSGVGGITLYPALSIAYNATCARARSKTIHNISLVLTRGFSENQKILCDLFTGGANAPWGPGRGRGGQKFCAPSRSFIGGARHIHPNQSTSHKQYYVTLMWCALILSTKRAIAPA